MKSLKDTIPFITIFIAQLTLAQNLSQTLFIGDKAPRIKVQKWFKGEPVVEFEKEHIYIVEFGNIACSPCRAAIPHMTDLSYKFRGRATLISIFTLGEKYDRLERFVNRMEERIGYTVALDDEQETMYNTWMVPARQRGIPTVFVIDKKGEIAWIGHPMDVEDVVEDLIAGYSDLKNVGSLQKFFQRNEDLKKSGDFKTALTSIDSMIAKKPYYKYLYEMKFAVLLAFDAKAAYALGWKILSDECKDAEAVLFYIARDLMQAVENSSIALKNPDWDLVIALTERAFQLSQDEHVAAYQVHLQAQAYVKKNQKQKAIEVLEKVKLILAKNEVENVNGTYDWINNYIQKLKE